MREADRSSRQWLHRPIHRDWAFWVSLAVGIGYWACNWLMQAPSDGATWTAALINLPIQVAGAALGFAVLVGCVRQFSLGLHEGRPRESAPDGGLPLPLDDVESPITDDRPCLIRR